MSETNRQPLAPPKHAGESWLTGVAQALPLVFGYVPVGFAFGVLAQKAGLSTANALLLSLIVYAGSSQLIAVGLFAAGVPAASIILTTFVVNLRHLLMSAALAPYFKHWRKPEQAAFAFELTDETFAIHSSRFAELDPSAVPPRGPTFALNVTAHVTWVCATALGIVAGQLVTDVRPLALDYALPAMFIGLLMFQLKSRVHVVVALVTGGLAVVLLLAGLEQWHVLAAAVIGATLGVGIEAWISKRSR